MEGDLFAIAPVASTISISIHSLRMEGDYLQLLLLRPQLAFQSTPSAWRETNKSRRGYYAHVFQSTPSAWRETFISRNNRCNGCISIHSLRMEGDLTNHLDIYSDPIFQSTPSAWRETTASCVNVVTSTFQSTPSAWRETHM